MCIRDRHMNGQDRVDIDEPFPAEADADRMVDRIERDAKRELGGELEAQVEGLGKGNAMEQLIDIVGGFARRIEELEMRLRK